MVYFIKKNQLLLYPSHIPRFYTDELTWNVDRQFLWGPGLLISPVLDPVGLTGFVSMGFGIYGFGILSHNRFMVHRDRSSHQFQLFSQAGDCSIKAPSYTILVTPVLL